MIVGVAVPAVQPIKTVERYSLIQRPLLIPDCHCDGRGFRVFYGNVPVSLHIPRQCDYNNRLKLSILRHGRGGIRNGLYNHNGTDSRV